MGSAHGACLPAYAACGCRSLAHRSKCLCTLYYVHTVRLIASSRPPQPRWATLPSTGKQGTEYGVCTATKCSPDIQQAQGSHGHAMTFLAGATSKWRSARPTQRLPFFFFFLSIPIPSHLVPSRRRPRQPAASSKTSACSSRASLHLAAARHIVAPFPLLLSLHLARCWRPAPLGSPGEISTSRAMTTGA